jgi:hypothetical protein
LRWSISPAPEIERDGGGERGREREIGLRLLVVARFGFAYSREWENI